MPGENPAGGKHRRAACQGDCAACSDACGHRAEAGRPDALQRHAAGAEQTEGLALAILRQGVQERPLQAETEG